MGDSSSDSSAGGKGGKDGQKELLASASHNLLEGSPLEAAEKFKSVLDSMACKPPEKIPMTQVVIRYALCIAFIKSNEYSHIAEATEMLCELVEGYGHKFPALYLALARAYFVLNRFQKALSFIEKGLKFIKNNSKVKQHSWPGLSQNIEESGRDILQKELLSLQTDCKKCPLPDASCAYHKCIQFSTHVSPSVDIYLNDPGFNYYLLVKCDKNCQLAYHESCWKHIRDYNLCINEPQDLIGMPCLSQTCYHKNHSVTVEVKLIGKDGIDKPLEKFSKSDNSSKSISTNGSATKAKPDHSNHPEDGSSIHLSPPMFSLYCSSLDDLRIPPIKSLSLSAVKDLLILCRSVKFGYLDNQYMNPELQCFGHPYADFNTFIQPEEIDSSDMDQADFVFSYYQSMFDEKGHCRIEDLQDNWASTISDLGLPKTFSDKYKNASEFLLKSQRFAAIDDLIGTSDLLPNMFSVAETEVTETIKFLLFSKVSNSPDKSDNHSDSYNGVSETKLNNNPSHPRSVCPSPMGHNEEAGSEFFKDDSDRSDKLDRDSNDNPIHSSAKSKSRLAINGSHDIIPNPTFVQDEFVYNSDEDEELSGGDSNGTSQTPLELPILSFPKDQKAWSKETKKIEVMDGNSQTDTIVDTQASEEKELLRKQILELYKEVGGLLKEKANLSHRCESLESSLLQMESNLSIQEAEHSKVISQLKQDAEHSLQEKNEMKKILEKYVALGIELQQTKEVLKDQENNALELENLLDKLRRSHAKEINNSVKKLQEERLSNEELKKLLKCKDQLYIQLWKEFCEFKIKKFNNICNDRVIVLSQLKDIMSDTLRPTKTDIKQLIEKYEEEMITVALKNNEFIEVYNQEIEKLRNGQQIQLPPVIELPDMNLTYPPEGAFEYLQRLMKPKPPKQEEFGLSRDLFSPADSRFYPTRSFGPSLTRENDVNDMFSSFFGQSHNDTSNSSNLWNNTFSGSQSTPSAMPFDVSSITTPHLPLQGFGNPSSMMNPQMNVMSSMMPFQSSSQNSAVQAMMGQTRSTPSPSFPFTSLNGPAYGVSASVPGAIGSKVSGVSTIQKPVPSTASYTAPSATMSLAPSASAVPLAPKTVASIVSAPSSSSSSSLGAVPKQRVQTSSAAMTPIIPSKSLVRSSGVKSKSNESNYEKLMKSLQRIFPTRTDVEIQQALKMARYRNGNTLSNLTHAEIVTKIEEAFSKQIRQSSLPASMGWEKFGEAAWGTAKAPVHEWQGCDQDECCICMNPMPAKPTYTLECKHSFHKECIRSWLCQESVCPICRTHSTMLEEYPPLG